MSNRFSTFFTIARFGPDSVLVLGGLVLVSIVLYQYGFVLLSVMCASVFVIIFLVESAEMIHLGTAKPRQILGSRCLVIKRVAGRADRGIVKVYGEVDDKLNSELWSAESDSVIEEGRTAIVKGMTSIILHIEEP